MLSLEGALSEELLLRCLSFLSAHELATVSRVSSAWYRLAQDPQVRFSPAHPALRGLTSCSVAALARTLSSHFRFSFHAPSSGIGRRYCANSTLARSLQDLNELAKRRR